VCLQVIYIAKKCPTGANNRDFPMNAHYKRIPKNPRQVRTGRGTPQWQRKKNDAGFGRCARKRAHEYWKI